MTNSQQNYLDDMETRIRDVVNSPAALVETIVRTQTITC